MKAEWKDAWRLARIIRKAEPQNVSALCSFERMRWLAWLRLSDREFNLPHFDTKTRFEQNKLADEIIDEILAEEK